MRVSPGKVLCVTEDPNSRIVPSLFLHSLLGSFSPLKSRRGTKSHKYSLKEKKSHPYRRLLMAYPLSWKRLIYLGLGSSLLRH